MHTRDTCMPMLIAELSLSLSPSLCSTGVWTQGLMLAKEAFYHLSHSASPVTIAKLQYQSRWSKLMTRQRQCEKKRNKMILFSGKWMEPNKPRREKLSSESWIRFCSYTKSRSKKPQCDYRRGSFGR
jgi:hypothetical protein